MTDFAVLEAGTLRRSSPAACEGCLAISVDYFGSAGRCPIAKASGFASGSLRSWGRRLAPNSSGAIAPNLQES